MEAALRAVNSALPGTSKLVNAFGKSVVQWAHPTLAYERRATRGWPLIELDAALLVALAYGVLVVYGLARYYCSAPAPAKAPVKKGEEESWAKRSAKEPILYAMQAYNLSQVVLCAYMIYGAASEALRMGYKPICNAFVPSATGMASILWVFYVSKVRGSGWWLVVGVLMHSLPGPSTRLAPSWLPALSPLGARLC